MEKLVIIGANEFQNMLILKAREMGYETHVFAWASGDIGERNADYFYPISITEKEAILEECKKIKPAGVVSIGSDLAVHTVCYVSEQLGLTSNRAADMVACTNKYEMRGRFKAAGLPTPGFCKVKEDMSGLDLSCLHFPVIVKPTDRSGSRGIMRVTCPEDLPAAVKFSTKDAFEKCAIVEDYIEGPEYSCEHINHEGKHYFLAITKKYTTGDPHYIENGHIQPPDLTEEEQAKVRATIEPALDALNIREGASHAEFKIDPNGVVQIIEIGARMGGGCIGSDLTWLSTGYDFVKMVIQIACGKGLQLERTGEQWQCGIRFIFTRRDMEILDIVKEKWGDCIYRISEIDTDSIGHVTDCSNRAGYYIFRSKDRQTILDIMSLC